MKRVAVLLLVGVGCLDRSPAAHPSLELGPGPSPVGFARATEVRPFQLPADHGPHYEFQTEWWYFTGNLRTDYGRHFGYQLTFFRRGLGPGSPPSGPGLATNQLYFAHFATTDASARTHRFTERWSRGSPSLAGARAEPFAVWLEGWRVEALDPDGSRLRLTAAGDGGSLDLTLTSRKPLARHGDRGLSAKSAEPGNASYYVGYTRLETRGQLGSLPVTGLSWFDHEWSTSSLGRGAVGWDWFSLQLDDARELMLFRIRRADGTMEPISGGTLVEADGSTRRLAAEDVRIDVLDHWTSRETRAVYPSRWTIAIASLGLALNVDPWLEAQEMRTSFVYWEGAVRVRGSIGESTVSGNGYVELTGYARSMQGVF